MQMKSLVTAYNNAIISIYRQQCLTCLRGLDGEYTLNGKNLLSWYLETTRRCSVKYGNQFNYFKNKDDILFCSDELLYFTAQLFLYRPYINSPLKDAFLVGENMVYPNYQNFEGKRYNMYADIAGQVAYNYWDKIGDLIASFFPDLIEQRNVYFSTAIEIIPADFHCSDNYKWLNNFKISDYSELNKKRKQIVLYSTSDTEYRYNHLQRTNDFVAMEGLQKEREYLAEYYKNHIALTLTGLEKTLQFLAEITPALFKDIP